MNLEEVTRRLRGVVDDLEGRLPDQDIESSRILLDAGEPEIALENLCAQISEYDVEVSNGVYARIRSSGEALGLAASNWTDLTVAPPESGSP